MSNTRLVLLILSLSMLNLVEPGLAARKTRSWLNDQLVMNVPDDDPEANFQWVRETLEGKHQPDMSSFEEEKLKKDMKMFLALQSMNSAPTCDQADYKILVYNNVAGGDHAFRRLNDVSHLKRVNKIAHHAMVEHARLCRDVHLLKFSQFRVTIDKSTEDKVKEIMDKLLQSKRHPVKWDNLAYSDVIMDYFLPAIEKLAENDLDLPLMFSINADHPATSEEKKKVKALIRKYFLNPCESFAKSIYDFFEPIMFDDYMISITPGKVGVEDFKATKDRFLMCLKTSHERRAPLGEKVLRVIMENNKAHKKLLEKH